MKYKRQWERSPTFCFAIMEGVLLATPPTGGSSSSTRAFRAVSRDGQVSLGARVATEVVFSIRVPVREKPKTHCTNRET